VPTKRTCAADAERVIQLAPKIMDGYYNKGFALFNLKSYAEAVRAMLLYPMSKSATSDKLDVGNADEKKFTKANKSLLGSTVPNG
jgi:hypothetical protein